MASDWAKERALPCGGGIVTDHDGEWPQSRCDTCFAVVGSVGMPRDCYAAWHQPLPTTPAQDRSDK